MQIKSTHAKDVPVQWESALSALGTCRQMHSEAKSIAYELCEIDLLYCPIPMYFLCCKAHDRVQYIVISPDAAQACIDEHNAHFFSNGMLIFPELVRLEARELPYQHHHHNRISRFDLRGLSDGDEPVVAARIYFEQPDLEIITYNLDSNMNFSQ